MKRIFLAVCLLLIVVSVAGADEKSSVLIGKSNLLYEKVNTYANTLIPQLTALLAEYGIDEAAPSVAGLTTRQKGTLLVAITPFVAAVADESGARTFETDLIAAGYSGPAEAIADVPNRYSGDTARDIVINFQRTQELLVLVDSLTADVLTADLLTALVGIKAKVLEIQPSLNKH